MNEEINKNDLVWYVSYGSNMDYARFMDYINECEDKTKPRESKAVILPFNMYFSGKSIRWHCPVSFLDTTRPGESYGVAYLIFRKQLEKIVKKEGEKYSKVEITDRVPELEEYPIFTLKASADSYSFEKRSTYESISQSYLNKIIKGLKDNFPNLTYDQIEAYLKKCCE